MSKSIPKEIRKKVYEKYGGRCAYCGCKLEYKNMQVDHIDAVYRAKYEGRQVDNSIDNYMPACRQCNFYKGTSTIEEFRRKIVHLEETVFNRFTVRLALKYGILRFRRWGQTFYFEYPPIPDFGDKIEIIHINTNAD